MFHVPDLLLHLTDLLLQLGIAGSKFFHRVDAILISVFLALILFL